MDQPELPGMPVPDLPAPPPVDPFASRWQIGVAPRADGGGHWWWYDNTRPNSMALEVVFMKPQDTPRIWAEEIAAIVVKRLSDTIEPF